jgi:hypothetical protein
VKRDITFEEWFFYAINRIAMNSEQRYWAMLEVGGTEEGALAEKNKTTLDILNDYRDYHDYDKVLSVWTEGT